jgi:hypothetical protein
MPFARIAGIASLRIGRTQEPGIAKEQSTQRASRMRGERVSQSRTFSINLVTDSPFQKDGLGGEGESPSRTGVARERRALPRQTACGAWHRHERDAQCLNFLHKIDPAAAARDGDG